MGAKHAGPGCKIDGCDRKHEARDLCFKHYTQYRRKVGLGRHCTQPGCDRPEHGRGLCINHHSLAFAAAKRPPAQCHKCGAPIPARKRICDTCRRPPPTVPHHCRTCGEPCGTHQRCPTHKQPFGPTLPQGKWVRTEQWKQAQRRTPKDRCHLGHQKRATSGGNWFCPTCRHETRRVHKNRRRAREDRGTLTGTEWRQILKTLGRKCVYCGGPFEAMDHVIPLARGGKHEAGNVVPACTPCNTDKAAKLLTEWRT